MDLPKSVAPEGYEGSWSCCKLGCGGWGCAYRCSRGGSGNGFVVFKVPRGMEGLVEEGVAVTVDERLLKRVVNEASTVSRLSHPHILRLLAYSTRAPLLVYEYADMGSLDQQFAKGWRPSMRDALLAAIQLGDALRYIHSRGLVHGDVKPGNVFIKDGVVRLGDFSSLVRLVTLTSRHALSYTPGWRAPEQAYSD
ncbi:MAG: protein kinase [Desulfurococcales archaeon]|nr:protein kinase [Desulfurococcales archaeon]